MNVENFKTIGCAFASQKRAFTYKTLEDFKEGDYAVVATERGFTVVRVVSVHPEPKINPKIADKYKWVVQRVDTSLYDKIKDLKPELS